jgi:hypothetical protein
MCVQLPQPAWLAEKHKLVYILMGQVGDVGTSSLSAKGKLSSQRAETRTDNQPLKASVAAMAATTYWDRLKAHTSTEHALPEPRKCNFINPERPVPGCSTGMPANVLSGTITIVPQAFPPTASPPP